MQDDAIVQLLQPLLPDVGLQLQVTRTDRHLHLLISGDLEPLDRLSELSLLILEEVELFVEDFNHLIIWQQFPNSDTPHKAAVYNLNEPTPVPDKPALVEAPVELSTVQPPASASRSPETASDRNDRGTYCFVRNARLLHTELPTPPPDVVRAVFYIHELESGDRKAFLDLLQPLFDRPDLVESDRFPAEHRDWVEQVRGLSIERRKGVAVWLSRYLAKPNRTLPLLEDSLNPTTDEDTGYEIVEDNAICSNKIRKIRSLDPQARTPSPSVNTEPQLSSVPGRFQEPDNLGRAAMGDVRAIAATLDAGLRPWQPRSRVTISEDELRVQLGAGQAPARLLATALVYVTLKAMELPPHLRSVKILAVEGDRGMQWKSEFALPVPHNKSSEFNRFGFENPVVNALAIPVALIAGMLVNTIVPILMLPIHIWIHEFGHATAAWLAGYRAIPLPFGWTSYVPTRNLFVYLGGLFLLGLFAYAGWQEKRRWPIVLAAAIAVLQMFFTWIANSNTIDLAIDFGGVGGEFYLSTLLMVAFYWRLPDRLRWDFWRFVMVFAGASTFCAAFWYWHTIEIGIRDIPWGSIFGAGDSGGDMNQLRDWHGWSDRRIISTYSRLGDVCAMALAIAYGFYAIKMNPQAWFGLRQRAIVWWSRNVKKSDRQSPV